MIKANYTAGDRHGRLTLTGKYYIKNKRGYLEWVCDCGKIGWSLLSNIFKENHTTSCGCLKKEVFNNSSHGFSKHPIYQLYNWIKNRCYNKDDHNYNNYGANGVIMCEEWLNDFMVFYNWCISNGWGKKLQIDKDILSPNKTGLIYSPEFCCFVTQKTNIRNRSITKMLQYKGEFKPFAEWCEIFTIRYATVFRRIEKLGWPIDMALETPTDLSKRNKNAKC